MLAALGARFLTASGEPVRPGGAALAELATADLSGLDPRLRSVEFVLASDVDNPLTGPKGAAAVYGPQKGASPEDVERLDAALAHLVKVLDASALAASPGAGAAGGIGFGALLVGARFRPGIEVMLDVLGFASALERADLVITGRGRWTSRRCTGRPRRRRRRGGAGGREGRGRGVRAAGAGAGGAGAGRYPAGVRPHGRGAGRGEVHRRCGADPGADGGAHRAGLPHLSRAPGQVPLGDLTPSHRAS